MTLRFDRESVCGDLDEALQREWLETNGLGGFASSTHLRDEHAPVSRPSDGGHEPPVGRMVLLSKFEETLVVGGGVSISLPTGTPERFIRAGIDTSEFRLDPFPVFMYEVDGIEIEKRVFMVQGENTTVVEYERPRRGVRRWSCGR